MKFTRRFLATGLTTLLTFGTTFAKPPRILFTSDRTGNHDIYTANVDGSDIVNLTNSPLEERFPEPSPDGTKIAYVSWPGGQEHHEMEIYIMNSDGKNRKQLTDNKLIDRWPRWLPDGKSLIFLREKPSPEKTILGKDEEGNLHDFTLASGDLEIYRVDINGNNETNLSKSYPHDNAPSISEQGLIAFSSNRDGNWMIYTMDLKGNNQKRLTKTFGENRYPKFSLDGNKIAFHQKEKNGNRTLNIINSDGSGQEDITSLVEVPYGYAWSPDGNEIAYSDGKLEQRDVYIINLKSSIRRRLTNGEGDYFRPYWSPDGKYIAFHSRESDGNHDIQIYNLKTNTTTKLTTPGDEIFHGWLRK